MCQNRHGDVSAARQTDALGSLSIPALGSLFVSLRAPQPRLTERAPITLLYVLATDRSGPSAAAR